MSQCFINCDGVSVSEKKMFTLRDENECVLFRHLFTCASCARHWQIRFFWLLSGLSTPGEEQFIGWNSVAFVSVRLKLLNFPVVLETNCFAAACWSLQTGKTPPHTLAHAHTCEHTHTRAYTCAAYLTMVSSGFMWQLSVFKAVIITENITIYSEFPQKVENEQLFKYYKWGKNSISISFAIWKVRLEPFTSCCICPLIVIASKWCL